MKQQQPASLQGPTETRHRPIRKLVIALVLSAGLVVVAGAVTGALWWQQTTRTTDGADKSKLAEELTKTDAAKISQTQKIVSKLGFSAQFSPDSVTARGQVNDIKATDDDETGMVYHESYEGDELMKERPYSILFFKRHGESALAAPDMIVSTNVRTAFWDRFKDEENADDRRLELLTKYIVEGRQDKHTTAEDTKTVKFNDTTYQRTVLKRDNSEYGVARASETHIYTTVQNGRPYWAVITNATADPVVTGQFEQVLSTVSYHRPDTSELGIASPQVTLAAAELPEKTSNTPETIDSDTVIPVVLRNQPAVVRILTLRCGEVTLKSGSRQLVLPHSCGGGVGSGSFISSDGYVATNGHVVTLSESDLLVQSLTTPEAVNDVLEFLVATGSMSRTQYSTFLQGLKRGDAAAKDALAQLPSSINASLISVHDDTMSYGVQTSNEPLRIDGEQINYGDTILEATLVAKDYDHESSSRAIQGRGSFTSSDVAILKVEGDEFPTVKLASGSSLGQSDEVTAIGYPAFVDKAINTDQWQTVPTITQGRVTNISDTYSTGGRILSTSVQIAPGNSGGPAFDHEGRQVGLMTYGRMRCSDKQCFGDGSLRDVEDLHQLVRKNTIHLNEGSLTDQWNEALREYETGNYKVALKQFERAEHEYPANYLASEMARLAKDNVGSDSDTSAQISTTGVMIMIGVSVASLGLVVMVVVIVLLIRSSRRPAQAA